MLTLLKIIVLHTYIYIDLSLQISKQHFTNAVTLNLLIQLFDLCQELLTLIDLRFQHFTINAYVI